MNSEVDFADLINRFPTFNSVPEITGDLRTYASDFQVDEVLSFKPSGEGEHLFLQVKKTDCNTEWVARQLQKKSGLTSRDIGYAGKKDRHSVSTQWFSLHLPGKQIDLSDLVDDEYEIIDTVRHNKKLRTGSLLENKFEIIIRNLSAKIDHHLVDEIIEKGVPNYFGIQRFGFEANNLIKADELLNNRIKIKNRNKRGLIISSARSLLFNLQLALRVTENSWLNPIKGDCLMLDLSQSFFVVDEPSDDDRERLKNKDLHICGWLAGKQMSEAKYMAQEKEHIVIKDYSGWLSGLEKLNLDSARRAFRCIPKNLKVEQNDAQAKLTFSLAKGCYATSLIRELVKVKDLAVRK